jgi:hypothetical protein
MEFLLIDIGSTFAVVLVYLAIVFWSDAARPL